MYISKYNNDRKLNIEIKEEASDFQDNDINIFDTLEEVLDGTDLEISDKLSILNDVIVRNYKYITKR